jgi:hypothetical protein
LKVTSTNISVGSWVSLKLGCGGQAFQRGTEHCFVGLVVGAVKEPRGEVYRPLVKFFSVKGLRMICTVHMHIDSLVATDTPADLPSWSVAKAPAET